MRMYQVNHQPRPSRRWVLCPEYKTYRTQGGPLSPLDWNWLQVESAWSDQLGSPPVPHRLRHNKLVVQLLRLGFDVFEARYLALFCEVTVRRLFNLEEENDR